MPSFIKNNVIITVSKTGFESEKRVLFTDQEIFERVKDNPSLIFEVTESHAAGVLRPQQKYQEINPDMLSIIAEDKEEALRPPLTAAQQAKLDKSNAKSKEMLDADLKATPEEKAIDKARNVVEGVDPLTGEAPVPDISFGG